MRSVEVRGHVISVDEGAFSKWSAFELFSVIGDESRNPFERTACMFEVVRVATGVEQSEIVEWAGGADAEYKDVFALLSEIVSEITPKN